MILTWFVQLVFAIVGLALAGVFCRCVGAIAWRLLEDLMEEDKK